MILQVAKRIANIRLTRIKQHLIEHVLANVRLYGMAKSERQRRRQKG